MGQLVSRLICSGSEIHKYPINSLDARSDGLLHESIKLSAPKIVHSEINIFDILAIEVIGISGP